MSELTLHEHRACERTCKRTSAKRAHVVRRKCATLSPPCLSLPFLAFPTQPYLRTLLAVALLSSSIGHPSKRSVPREPHHGGWIATPIEEQPGTPPIDEPVHQRRPRAGVRRGAQGGVQSLRRPVGGSGWAGAVGGGTVSLSPGTGHPETATQTRMDIR